MPTLKIRKIARVRKLLRGPGYFINQYSLKPASRFDQQMPSLRQTADVNMIWECVACVVL